MTADETRGHRRFRPWREVEVYRRHVFYLSASRLISITGSFAAYVALVAVIYDRSHHSGAWVAAGLTASMVVSALSGPWAGHLGDRFDRRRVMIASDLVGAATFASDLPAIVLALDGEIDVVGPDGKRTVPAAEFFQGVFQTAAGAREMVTEVRVPKLTGDDGWSYVKFRRRAQDWATVGVAAVVKRRNGDAGSAAIALVNMGATPLRAHAAEQAFAAGGDPAAVAADGADPPDDTNGSAEYRRYLASVLVRRALAEASRP